MIGSVGRSVAIFTGVVICVVMTSLPAAVTSESLDYRARVRVYVDKSGVDEFNFDNPGKNLTKHVGSMVEKVNHIYESLLPTLNITLYLERVIAMDKDIFKNILYKHGNKAIYVDWTGYEFWNYTRKIYEPKEYDLAILLTGFEMYSRGDNAGTFGHGYQGSACTENGVGAVEIQEPVGTIGMAHEIGHILGAAHDEEAPKSVCGPGSYKYGNLMNIATKLNNPRRFQFSECSLKQIQAYIADLDKRDNDCLIPKPEKNMTIPALETTADELCEQQKGKGWAMHRNYANYTERFCSYLECVKFENGDRKTEILEAPNGLKCGKSKRCFDKECVYSSYGDPNMSDMCPWGSQDEAYVKDVYRASCARLTCKGYGRMCCGRCT